MKPKTLKEIWDVEEYYDEIRWASDKSIDDLELNILINIKTDIGETIRALSGWLNRKLRPENYKVIKILKRKLLDFQWQLVQEVQRRERSEQHYQRVGRMWDPQPKVAEPITPDYGLREPFKATPFYRDISPAYNPIPRQGVTND